MNNKSLYLKNLNALRAFAAYMVVIHHIEQFKTHFDLPNLWHNNTIRELGGNAVSIFFVLSGFLISYLLLKEKEKTGTISLRKFYIRRILRIWPLFFILLTIGLIANYFWGDFQLVLDNLLYFIFFIPNILVAQAIVIPFIAHLWSIGVEEQFYLFWPLIALKTNRKKFLVAMLIIILAFLISRNLIFHYQGKSFYLKLLNYTRFDLMAMGGIGAIILTSTNDIFVKIKNLINSKTSQIIIILGFIFCLLSMSNIYKIYFLENIFFGSNVTLLLLVLVSEKSILNLEFKLSKTLGDISYGIYMYHAIAIFITLKIITQFSFTQNALIINLILYPVSILLSSIIAYFSYEYIEKGFLKLKEKFVVINSKP